MSDEEQGKCKVSTRQAYDFPKFKRWQRQKNRQIQCSHKLKDGQKHKRVRRIEEVVDESGQGSSAAPNSGTSPSNGRLVRFAPSVEETWAEGHDELSFNNSSQSPTLHGSYR